MTSAAQLPDGLELARTTPEFTESTVPAGLCSAHQIAPGVWGQLLVRSGSVGFVFEDEPDVVLTVQAGGHVVIAPQRLHHVVIDGPVVFAVEFHREPR